MEKGAAGAWVVGLRTHTHARTWIYSSGLKRIDIFPPPPPPPPSSSSSSSAFSYNFFFSPDRRLFFFPCNKGGVKHPGIYHRFVRLNYSEAPSRFALSPVHNLCAGVEVCVCVCVCVCVWFSLLCVAVVCVCVCECARACWCVFACVWFVVRQRECRLYCLCMHLSAVPAFN